MSAKFWVQLCQLEEGPVHYAWTTPQLPSFSLLLVKNQNNYRCAILGTYQSLLVRVGFLLLVRSQNNYRCVILALFMPLVLF